MPLRTGPGRVTVRKTGTAVGLTRFICLHDEEGGGVRYVNLGAIAWMSIKELPDDPDRFDVMLEERSSHGTQWYELDRVSAERIREALGPGVCLHVTMHREQGRQEPLRN